MDKFIYLIVLFFSVSSRAYSKELSLSLGESLRLPAKGSSSVWIQDREILKAEGSGGSILIRGFREGRTVLKIGSDTYQVHILHPNKKDSLADLRSYLKNIVGISSKVSEGDLLIDGQIYRMGDWIKLAQFARDKSFTYIMKARLSPDLTIEAQNHFRDLIERARLPPQTIIFEPKPEIRIKAKDDVYKKYQTLFNPYGISVIKDDNSIEVAPTVKVEITVAEIKRSFSLQYGLRWPSSYSATVLNSGKTVADDLPFNLKALEDSGYGKILASPNLLCRSGKEAEFLAGGEFPIKILNYKSQDIVWKRYGILLRVKPVADSAGRISLSIETEVSTLDASTAVDNIPGVLTNRVSSHFDLAKPKTIALSGLLKSEEGKNSSGLPMLSRLPVIGALFSSKDFRENRSELVIFVRPTILSENDSFGGIEHIEKGPTNL